MTDTPRRTALVTGGASGIGAGVALRLAERGDNVVLLDLDADRGGDVASRCGGALIRGDAGVLRDVHHAVDNAVRAFGGLDIAVLNAGIAGGPQLDEHFNDARYRHILRANLDSVVYGAATCFAAMRDRGGDIVCTASLAGLTGLGIDPVYTATKHAVVGMVRALGGVYAADGVRINAVCPGFADTPIIEPIRDMLAASDTPLLSVDDVADAFIMALESQRSGECWFVQPGRPPEPFRFATVPGPKP